MKDQNFGHDNVQDSEEWLPKFWQMKDQFFGKWKTKILVNERPKFWWMKDQNFLTNFLATNHQIFSHDNLLVYTDKLDKDYEQKYKLDKSI